MIGDQGLDQLHVGREAVENGVIRYQTPLVNPVKLDIQHGCEPTSHQSCV